MTRFHDGRNLKIALTLGFASVGGRVRRAGRGPARSLARLVAKGDACLLADEFAAVANAEDRLVRRAVPVVDVRCLPERQAVARPNRPCRRRSHP
jgi:hypothetical protein